MACALKVRLRHFDSSEAVNRHDAWPGTVCAEVCPSSVTYDECLSQGFWVVDNFRSVLNAALDPAASGWSELDHIVDYLNRLLARPDGKIDTTQYRCADTENSTVSRDTAEETRDAIRLNHIKPHTVSVTISASTTTGLAWKQTLTATVRLGFDDGGSARRLNIDLDSTDKLLLMGVKAQLQNELDAIDSWSPEQPPPAAESGNYINNFHGPVNVGAIGGQNSLTIGSQSIASASGALPSSEPSWWAQTWRDHAMALIVTVVGTIVAAALVALWGINGWTFGAASTELHLDEVTWTQAGTLEVTGTVEHLREDDEVWVFSEAADGFSGVYPRGECEIDGGTWTCNEVLGTDYESGYGYVITAAVLTRKSANEIRAIPRSQLFSYADADGIPRIEDPGAIDDITTWRP